MCWSGSVPLPWAGDLHGAIPTKNATDALGEKDLYVPTCPHLVSSEVSFCFKRETLSQHKIVLLG